MKEIALIYTTFATHDDALAACDFFAK